jgi:hypothetical protein
MTRRLALAVTLGCLAIGPPCAFGAPLSLTVTPVGPKDGGGEPSIASGPEGNLYVSYPSDSGMSFFRSFDDGGSWSAGALAATSSGDTAVNVDSSGAVYQSNLNGDGNLQGDVYKSFDFGTTWPQRGTSADGQDATSQPLLVDREWTDAYIPPGKTTNDADVYMEYHDFGPSQVWATASHDGGKTFGLPVDIAAASPQSAAYTFCNSIPGGLKIVQSGPHAGRIYAAWLAGDPVTNPATGCNLTQLDTFHTIWIAWSDDKGATWTSQLVYDGGFGHDASALFADLTLDSAGNPYVAFGDNIGDEWDMWVEASFDGAKTWNGKSDGTGVPYKVNADTGTHFFPAIAAGAPGHVDVAWIGTPTKIDTLPYGKPSPGGGADAKWYLFTAQSADVDGGSPTWTQTQVTPDPIHVGDVCTLGIFCVSPDSNRDLLDFIDLAVDPAGMAHVAFTQDTPTANGIYAANQTGGDSVFPPPPAPTPATAASEGTGTSAAPAPAPASGTLGVRYTKRHAVRRHPARHHRKKPRRHTRRHHGRRHHR